MQTTDAEKYREAINKAANELIKNIDYNQGVIDMAQRAYKILIEEIDFIALHDMDNGK